MSILSGSRCFAIIARSLKSFIYDHWRFLAIVGEVGKCIACDLHGRGENVKFPGISKSGVVTAVVVFCLQIVY